MIELMLEAANWAPTHGKTEPWRYHGTLWTALLILRTRFTVMSDEIIQEFQAVVAGELRKGVKEVSKSVHRRRFFQTVIKALAL